MSVSQINNSPTPAIAEVHRRYAAAASSSVEASSQRRADSVELSESARALHGANGSVKGARDVRQNRVAAVKAAIASGTYSVDSRALARSILAFSA
jgi:negative regulator of flagellin synthesis FlgM